MGRADRVQALLDEALAIMRRVEWEGGDGVVFKCPACRRWKLQGHEPACPIRIVLDGQKTGGSDEETSASATGPEDPQAQAD